MSVQHPLPAIAPHSGQLTVVPNRIVLNLRLAQHHRLSGAPEGAWFAPPIQLFSKWLQGLHFRTELLLGNPALAVPDRLQLRNLWADALARERPELLPGEVWRLAGQAMDACRKAVHWALIGAEVDDPPALGRVPKAVRQALARQQWATQETQYLELLRLLEAGAVPRTLLPASLVLDGFMELTLLEQRLLEGLEGAGVKVQWPGSDMSLETETASPRFERHVSLESELRAAAQWAAQRAKAGAGCVGVLVNQLDSLAPLVHSAFADAFQPGQRLALNLARDAGYHVAGPEPLAGLPLVRDALLLLSLSLAGPRQRQAFDVLSRWLLAPCWAGAEDERFQRALLEQALRKQGACEASLASVADLARKFAVPELLDRLTHWPAPVRRPSWASWFTHWLQFWGWPGPLLLDARGQSVHEALQQALERVDESRPASPSQALETLRRYCAEMDVAPVGGPLSAVQVLAPEDALGARFDAIRIVNVHAENWPPVPRRNPLLAGIRLDPRAFDTPASNLARMEALQRSIFATAPEIVISRSAMERDVPLADSPRLPGQAGASEVMEELPGLASLAWPAIAEAGWSPPLEPIAETPGLPLPAVATELPHAVNALALQAACPLAAYLVHRLAARFEPVPTPFTDAAFAGSLLHRALFNLYAPHLDHGTSPGEGEAAPAVKAALDHLQAERWLPPAAIEAEQERLVALLREWLAQAPERGLEHPLKLEQELQLELAGLNCEMRMDRCDPTGDGRLQVMDYKSGNLPSVDWSGARILEPQLPMYALGLHRAGGEAPGSLVLASVKNGAIKYKGLADFKSPLGRGVTDVSAGSKIAGRSFANWQAALDHWSASLEALALEFREGLCEHRVYQAEPLKHAGLELLLRQSGPDPENSEEAGDEND